MKLSIRSLFRPSKKSSSPSSKNRSASSSSSDDSSSSSSPHQSTPRSVLIPTRPEIEAVLLRLGSDPPTEDDVAAIMAELAGDVTCAVDGDDLRDAFSVFDADGDGRISAEELLRVFITLGDEGCTLEDCNRMIGGVDMDSDGFVCFEEFVTMMSGDN